MHAQDDMTMVPPFPPPNNNNNSNTTAPTAAVATPTKKSKNPLAEFLRKNIKRDHRHFTIPAAAAVSAATAAAAPAATDDVISGQSPPQRIATTAAATTTTTPSVSSLHSGSSTRSGVGGAINSPFPSFVAPTTPLRGDADNNNSTVTTTTSTGATSAVFASGGTATVVNNNNDDDPPSHQQEEASEEDTNAAAAADAASAPVVSKNEANSPNGRLCIHSDLKFKEENNTTTTNNINVNDDDANFLSMSNHSSCSAIGLPLEDTPTPPLITATSAAALSRMMQQEDAPPLTSTAANAETLAHGKNVQQERSQAAQPQQVQQPQQQQQLPQLSLEERVTELELKLAVLSRLLHTQKATTVTSTSSSSALSSLLPALAACPSTPPPPPPSCNNNADFMARVQQQHHAAPSSPHHTTIIVQRDNIDHSSYHYAPPTTSLNNKQGSIFATDATSSLFVPPPPIINSHRVNDHHDDDEDDDAAFQDSLSFSLKQQHDVVNNTKRNLSFQLLYEKDEQAYQDYCRHKGKNIPPNIESMTPADRKWLGRDIQARLLQQRQEQEEEEAAANNDIVQSSQTMKQQEQLQSQQRHVHALALKTREDDEGKEAAATLEADSSVSALAIAATTTTVSQEKQQEASTTNTTTTGATSADILLSDNNSKIPILVVQAANANTPNNQETSIVSSTYDDQSTVAKSAAYAEISTTVAQSAISSLPSPQKTATTSSSSSTRQSVVSSTAPSPNKTTSTTTASTSSSAALNTNNTHYHNDEDQVRHKWLNYLNSFQESTPDVDVQMEEFIQVPGHVENLMSFGYFICIDAFLYIITILPIRFVWSLMLLILKLVSTIFRSKKQKQASQQQQDSRSNRSIAQQSSPFQFHRRHTYQMIQVFLLVTVYRFVLSPISIGVLYHYIRGQAMLKLYVLIAIVEVFDRLLCSLGQDCLDSLYWNTVNRPRSKRMIISVVVVLFYTTMHSVFLFVHVATMNVAMNSNDQALLTLFISGNFAEIKSTVFKKYNKPALFKLTVCDICERFKLGLFLALVLLLNLAQGMDRAQFLDYLRICGIVFGAEILADWIKHSFIAKFNFLPSKVYTEYGLLLAGDVTGIGHEGFNLDHSYAVVKRIGFAQIPLVCVMFRLVREMVKYVVMAYGDDVSPVFFWSVAAGVWLTLLAAKLVIGSFLYKISMARLRAAPEVSASVTLRKKKKE